MRVSLGLIVLTYLFFGAILLLGINRQYGIGTTFGIVLFVVFGIALISHLAAVLISRTWIISLGCIVSVLCLGIMFIWVLHKVTGDSI